MKTKAPHILNTSANLMGLCFIVLTSLRVNRLSEASIIDELTAFSTLFFIASSLLSFLSMKNLLQRGAMFEWLADWVFLLGLVFTFLIIVLITFNIIR